MSTAPSGRSDSHLPRLDENAYRGLAFVHWVMTIAGRGTGWLSPAFHASFREILLHATIRYHLDCPAYCLMPDHVHLVLLGTSDDADQRRAIAFLRRYSTPLLRPAAWQREPFDHVLREEEREKGALMALCHYVRENPVRKGLVARAEEYAYAGAISPGYPELNPRLEAFWERFWQAHNAHVQASEHGADRD
jgi:REP element-mobilizing transposase RayT